MASTPLILTLTVLTATVLVLLILWVFIRYTKDRRARSLSQPAEPHLQVNQGTTYAAENGESRVHLHCAYQPSNAPHEQAHDVGLELQTVNKDKEEDVHRAEVWLKRGASKDNSRGPDQHEGVLETKTVRGWDMMGIPRETGLESAGRR